MPLLLVLTISADLLLWSSGVGVALLSRGGAKAESLLLLTNRGVSGTRKTRVRNRETEEMLKASMLHL